MPTNNSPAVQPVSLAACPLPSGAAQDSTLTNGTQVVKHLNLEVVGAAIAATNGIVIASTDTTGFASWTVVIQGSGSWTLTFQASDDQSVWFSVPVWGTTQNTNAATSTTSAVGMFSGPIVGKYHRVIMTTYTSGTGTTVASNAEFSTRPFAPWTMGVAVNGTVTTNASAVASGGYSYTNITTATTTTVKSGTGYLRTLNINTGGAGSTATVYDSTTGSGTKIGTYDTSAARNIVLDLAFTTGLTIVTTSTAPDITVTWK